MSMSMTSGGGKFIQHRMHCSGRPDEPAVRTLRPKKYRPRSAFGGAMSFEQLNEILAMPVPPPLPAAPQPALDHDELLRQFIGPEAGPYIAIYNEARANHPDKPFTRMWRWSWPAALWFLPWALYRKTWLFGGSVAIGGIILALLFPAAATATGLALAVLTGFISNRAYLQFATAKIAKLKTRSSSEDELLGRIRRAGGVSLFGAWFGVIVVVCSSMVAFIAAYNAALNQH
jgi:hypothetical protein